MKHHILLFVASYYASTCFSPAHAQPNINITESSNSATEEEILIDCPLCSNPFHFPQDPFSIFVAGDATMTCQTAYDMGPLLLPPQNCSFWQQRGSTICQCGSNETSPPTDCMLCEDGQALPDAFLEVQPDIICGQVQIQARRDASENCVVWQQTYGVYCGCNNTRVTGEDYDVCRLCGINEFFDPLALVDGVQAVERQATSEEPLSCGEIEFLANFPSNNCDEYVSSYSRHCCRRNTASPSQAPSAEVKDAATHSQISWVAALASMVSLVYLYL